MIVRIELVPARAVILVLHVPRGLASGVKANAPSVDLALIQDGRPLRKALELDDLTEK